MVALAKPGVAFHEFEHPPAGGGDLVIDGGAPDEVRDRDGRILLVCDEEARDIEAGQVQAVVDAMLVLFPELPGMPAVELQGKENVELDVHVGALPVDARAGVAHLAHHLSSAEALAGLDRDLGEVGVEAEEGAVAPVVLHHHVFPVVAGPGAVLCVSDVSGRDGPDLVEGTSGRVTFDGPDVDPFVKTGGDDPFRGAFHVAHEPVLSSLPWFRGFSLEGPVDVHVVILGSVGEDGPVVGGKVKLERLGDRKGADGEEAETVGEEGSHHEV